MRFTLMLLVVFFASISNCTDAAVRTVTPTSYALRPCSTCKEVVYPTESECRAAALAEAERVGVTRTSGSAVYTCITRYNVVATFYPGTPIRRAILNWEYTPEPNTPVAEGFRVIYGASPTTLINTVQLSDPGARGTTIENLDPGTYYFAVKAYAGGNESSWSNVISKVIL